MSKLNIIINGRIVQGYKGETILELASRLGIEIPTLCHDERLPSFSSCYVCVVEVEGMRGLQPACSTRITEGMRIETENEKVRKSRKMALELLTGNHYADCIAPCRETCPAGVDVQAYIAMIDRGMYREAVEIIKQTNPLPAICGRVCVRPCELACRRNLLEDTGVGIDYLKRFASDIDLDSDKRFTPEKAAQTGKKVAIIGAGPGGLTAAYYLAIDGHHAEIFEASPHPGGMLRYGIPPYRLPNDIIDHEVESITDLGVIIHYNKKLGENLSYEDLKNRFDSVILAIGSQAGTRIGCENDDAGNIFSGIDFLRNMEMTGQKYDFSGKTVAVIGGGNTAMDCCRTAMRCGASQVVVLYRRTEKEMPANPIEIHESKLEGIQYNFLTAPARVNMDENGNVKSICCFRMELGEPDASGRRRPVKVEGSEFDVKADFVLAAIGQKTVVQFIEDIGKHAGKELKLNKWGDIDADPLTLQTSIENVFACGDGVTGPATLIEAIKQGRMAARSCSQYLSGKTPQGEPYEFLSRKEHFEKQARQEYQSMFSRQNREEMPTLDPSMRNNFNEVELGYEKSQARNEVQRCLECGCSELHSCDLKKYATKYGANQTRFGGEFSKYKPRYDHPYIEIDNNKCILCGRCVRICSEVVGANALGFVNRGFDTYVAPSMGHSLTETRCESCGMCIDTCPTGAITENVPFKPAPVITDCFKTICNYCSIGCELNMEHVSGFVSRVTGSKGLVNRDGSICRFGKFGYRYINDSNRISRPLLKTGKGFIEIGFNEAFEIIAGHMSKTEAAQQAFYVGARLTNEEIYLIQKLARLGVGTNNISSFHYMDRGGGYHASMQGAAIEQLHAAKRLVLLGGEIHKEQAVAGFYAYANKHRNQVPLQWITTTNGGDLEHKADETLRIKSYYHFLKASIYYILTQGKENRVFIDDHCENFESYREAVLAQDFQDLLTMAGATESMVASFADGYNLEPMSIMVFGEAHLSSNAVKEARNLGLLLGKTGKTAAGLISLKEKNNAQGLLDMGACAGLTPGGLPYANSEAVNILKEIWNTTNVPKKVAEDQWQLLASGHIKNAFIFGEDPVGCAVNKEEMLGIIRQTEFLVVQDLFMTETAAMADIVLPASLHFESGGSFTNTQRFIQQFQQTRPSAVEINGFGQIGRLLQMTGASQTPPELSDVMQEIASILYKTTGIQNPSMTLENTPGDNPRKKFLYGCDHLVKRFSQEWEASFTNKP